MRNCDWEQRKLGELLTEVKRPIKMKDDESYELVTVKRRNEGIVSRGIFKGKDVLVNSQFQIKTGDYLISKRQVVHGANGIVPNHLNNAIVSNEYLVSIGNKNITTDFLSIISRLPSMYRKFFLSSYGIDIEKLVFNVEDWKKRTIQVPGISEQNQITTFFNQLDNTIALHLRMSDKQKKLKANLLQLMFPRNEEKIPEVRLAGFTEDWAQSTLEDISDKVTEKNKAREFNETLTNSAEYGIISQSDFFDKDISNINNIDGYYVVRPDDFVYNPRISNFAPVGPIKRNTLNRIGIMSPLYYVFRTKEVDHTFLEKYFETSYWHIFMKMNGDSGARADRFAIKDAILKEMPIPYPIKEEQVRIGIFFNQLDKSIALHQEKIAHLKVLKRTLLNKMFI